MEERALRTRPCPDLSMALSATTDAYLYPERESAAWDRFRRSVRLTRYGADAYAYAMVAMGKLDIVIERGLKCWDVEAAVPLLAGAGGIVTNWTGKPIGDRGGQMLVVGDPSLLAQVTPLLIDSAD